MELDALSVAIDGPAGSGKSTVARRLAERLGLTHVDTGAMYRALTLVALREDLSLDDGEALGERLAGLDLGWQDDRLLVEGDDPGAELRGPEVTAAVSQVSAHGPVRRQMQKRQRILAWRAERGVVMEGRDIGSQVLPLAACKIYLDASARERARRRILQEGGEPDEAALDAMEAEIRRRDRLDSEREESPLTISPDAHVLDTSDLSEEEVVERCAEIAEASRPKAAPPEVMAPLRFQHGRYRLMHGLLRWIFTRLLRTEIRGQGHEQVPTGLIYACNHVSYWDPPIVGACLSREVHFLAKRELFLKPIAWFLRAFNAVPIVRGRYDPVAFQRAREVLAETGNLLIFPEGTRKPVGRPGPVKKGLGILVMETGQPYVPCYVEGTPGAWRGLFGRHRVRLWIGPPIRLHALERLRADLGDREIQVRVGELYLAQMRAFMHRAEAEGGLLTGG